MRTAVISDAERIMELIDGAKLFFRTNGIDMWQRGYPTSDDILDDISDGSGYVCTDGGVIGYIALTFDITDFHSTLQGTWQDDRPAVFHRLVVDPDHRGKGIGSSLIGYAEDIARKKGCRSMRAETDAGNGAMRRLMKDLGYSERGVLLFNGREKLGLEKIL